MKQASLKRIARNRLYNQMRKFNELHPNEVAMLAEMTTAQLEMMRNWMVYACDAGYKAASNRMPKPAYVAKESA